jgi:Xaa-Pro dipeptidase
MSPSKALVGVLNFLKIPTGSRVEIPCKTTYLDFLKFVERCDNYDVICRQGGFEAEIEGYRAIKDETEIAIYRDCAKITNVIIDLLVKAVSSGKCKTEMEAALFIDQAARMYGCDGTGFGTLAAGADRSFGIHCFPGYTSGAFANKGLSILDFGLCYKGYTSDVTLTFARGLSKEQEKLLNTVEKAFTVAYNCVKGGAGEEGISARDVAIEVDKFFAKSKQKMPHGLGHGIGLQAHEAPYLRNRANNNWLLRPNMIFTIEPGLYNPLLGGARFENDILLLKDRAEILTKSAIVRL